MHLGKKIGIIGGGQLGKMMIVPANLLGFKTIIYTNSSEDPACVFANEVVIGDFNDKAKLEEFASKCDFITIEFEGVDVTALKSFESKLSPNTEAIFISQNRLREKTFFQKSGIKTANFAKVNNKDEALEFFQNHGHFILKTTENGYDGKGQFSIKTPQDLSLVEFGKTEFIAEKFLRFAFEASVILTRSADGKIAYLPIPINIHKDGILHKSIVKSTQEPWKEKMLEMAGKTATDLNFIGTMAVEFFILENGEIIANEIAPRPHNSGHFSLDLCTISQFENHIRAIAGMPILKSQLIFEGEMLNLIGEEINLITKYLDKQNSRIHIYGKEVIKSGRKMGHINFIYDEIFT